jgi:hypothetical protein
MLGAAVARGEHREHLGAVLPDRLHERVEDDLDALFFEGSGELGGAFLVVAEGNAVDGVDNRDP